MASRAPASRYPRSSHSACRSRAELDGGGSKLFPAYLEIVRELPRPRRIFEWCSGPGFIGFSMLANGLCDSLCLADINPAAVDCCRRTVADNGLSDRVSVYHSDNLRDISVGRAMGSCRQQSAAFRHHDPDHAAVSRPALHGPGLASAPRVLRQYRAVPGPGRDGSPAREFPGLIPERIPRHDHRRRPGDRLLPPPCRAISSISSARSAGRRSAAGPRASQSRALRFSAAPGSRIPRSIPCSRRALPAVLIMICINASLIGAPVRASGAEDRGSVS